MLPSEPLGVFSKFSASLRRASDLNDLSLGGYKPQDFIVSTTLANSGNAVVVINAISGLRSSSIALLPGTPLSGFTIVQQRPSIKNPLPPVPPTLPSGDNAPCSTQQTQLTYLPNLPPPGTENDSAQASNFRIVCRVSSGQIVTQETGATPCVVDGVSHQGLKPRTVTLPQQITYLRQWTPDGGATWENFANVDIVFSDSIPPTVACAGYGPGSLVTTTYWDGSQTELDGSYNQ